jgi:hypothetical protein
MYGIQVHDNGNAACLTWRVVNADGTTGPWHAGPVPAYLSMQPSK